MEAGINLYSVRTLIYDEDSFMKTAATLRQAGYSYMQFSGAQYVPERIKKVSAASGLPVCLTHVPMDRIINDTDRLMSEHESFGCRYIGLGAMPHENITDPEKLKYTVSLLNNAGRKMRADGFKLMYHHHHFEMFRQGGQTVLEYILENSDCIDFTVDTYWLQYGGADVTGTIDRLRGRMDCVHLKDYRIECRLVEGRQVFEPHFAPVGDGNLDFSKIVEHALASGAKYFFVEQDDAVTYPDPLEQVGRSIKYIKERL